MSELVTSTDGTQIAFDRYGSGSPIILVGGAMQFRSIRYAQTTLGRLFRAVM